MKDDFWDRMTVNQDNLHLLLPGSICWLAEYLIVDRGMTEAEAIATIYRSRLYTLLEREETKLWHLGPVALYYDLRQELDGNTDYQPEV